MESAPPTPTEAALHPPVRNTGMTAQRLQPLLQSRSEGDIPVGPTLTPTSLMHACLTAATKPTNSYVSARGQPCNPLDKYMDATMPAVHLTYPTTAFKDIDMNIVDEWDNSPGKLLALPFDEEALDMANHHSIRGQILAAITKITQSQCVAVSAPQQSGEAKLHKCTPTTFLIYHLTEAQHQTLLQRGVWSSTSITFRVTPFDPPCPDFLFAIQGLLTLNTDDIRIMVQTTWCDAITIHALDTIILETSETECHEATIALQAFIESMWVEKLDIKAMGALPTPFNVFVKGSYIK
jgi:hypothetical protein